MGHRILILPSRRQFRAEPGENLLEAGLRSGLNLRYNCSSGTCGECRARLVTGRLGAGRFHDFAFSEAEKAQGYILLCRSHAAGDLVLEAAEADAGEDIPHQRVSARVMRVERPDPDHAILHLRTPRTRTLRFLAGQTVDLDPGAGAPSRLAVASCPCNGMQLQFHLHRGDAAPVVGRVFGGALRTGDLLELSGPYGDFILDEDSPRPLLFVAAGTGFAPIKSLIEHAIALELTQPMTLLWFAEATGGHYQPNVGRAWADALDAFSYLPRVSAGGWQGAAGETAALAQEGSDVYVAGGRAFEAAVAQALACRDCRTRLFSG